MRGSDVPPPPELPRRRLVASVRAFVELLLRMRGQGMASPSGQLFDRARLFAVPGDSGGMRVRDSSFDAGAAADERASLHAALAMVWGSLSLEQQVLLELQHRPMGTVRVAMERHKSQLRPGEAQQIVVEKDKDDVELPPEMREQIRAMPFAAIRARGNVAVIETMVMFPMSHDLPALLAAQGFGRCRAPERAADTVYAADDRPGPLRGGWVLVYSRDQVRFRIRTANRKVSEHPVYQLLHQGQ